MDFYNILWIEKWATKEEIKVAYRKLAMKYHPDRNAWNEEKFKQINEAYSTLSDDNKRKQYDMFWKTWWTWDPFWWWFWWNVDVDLWDIFESFFWWGFNWQRQKRKTSFVWEDIESIINIDLKTSIYWWKQKIKINKKETCKTCNWEWWKWKKTCTKCNWKWQVIYTSQSMFWTIQQTMTCDQCSWTWEMFEKICLDCNWEKRKLIKKEIDIDIPAWIDNWMIIKLNWEWNDWIWINKSWDLYVKFIVNLEEKNLKRKWVDLYYTLEIDIIEAILWTKKEINIPVIWKRNIEIKAWTQTDTIIKISWDWVKYIDNETKWNLYIDLAIKIPKKLWKTERELYEKIAKEKKLNVNKGGVFEKLFW